jgi:putative ABC transport system permease protein
VTAAAVTLLPATVGALLAARRVVRLVPAEAMRPPSPARYHRGVLSRLGLARLAGPLGRMIVRDLERRPVISGVSIAGIAFAGAIVILGRFSLDAVDHLMDVIMGRALRGDVTVSMARPVPRGELDWFRHAPGVLAAEPMRVVPVRLRHGWRTHLTTLSGWPAGADLRSVIDGDANPVPLPGSGVLLTDILGAKLGLRAGDAITVERLDEDRDTIVLPVAGLVDERMGMNAYMDLDALSRALGEEPQMNAVVLLTDPGQRLPLLRRLSEVPAIVAISETRSFRDIFEKQAGEMMTVMTLIVVVFATVIAIGVIYNTARVALSERGRDLATLRVLGFTRAEVAGVLLGQLAVQVVVALPLAMLFGDLLIRMLVSTISPEEFRFPAVIAPVTYAFASLVVIGAALAAALVVRRRLDRIDIVSALKARD